MTGILRPPLPIPCHHHQGMRSVLLHLNLGDFLTGLTNRISRSDFQGYVTEGHVPYIFFFFFLLENTFISPEPPHQKSPGGHHAASKLRSQEKPMC